MAKVRVYELARELGLESKVVLETANEIGEFVRSASSSLEAPVVRRLKEKLADRIKANDPAAEAAKARAEELRAKALAVAAAKAAAKKAEGEAVALPTKVMPKQQKTAPEKPETAVKVPKPEAKPAPKKVEVPKPEAKREAAPRPVPRPPVPKPPVPRPPTSRSSRPGNNPFSHRGQGMGVSRRNADSRGPKEGGRDSGRGRGNKPGSTSRPGNNATTTVRGTAPNTTANSNRNRGRSGFSSDPMAGAMGAPNGVPNTGRGRGRGRPAPGAGTQGAFGRGNSKRNKKSRKQRRAEVDEMTAPVIGGVRIRQGDGQKIRLRRGSSLTDLAEKIGVEAAALVQVLFNLGEMVNATQSVADDTLQVLGVELNYDIEVVSPEDEDRELLESFDIEFGENEGDEADLAPRPPVVTVMGHVDHGKTKLLDAFRHSNVVAQEAGGITQAIGAYQVETTVDNQPRKITFIDTPGHEAFTAMRARGAKTTDIAVLVVAADDGVMPQTIEALNHAKAADVPIVVAVNKIDKEGADPARVRGEVMEFGLVPEEYGGDTMFIDCSAVTRDGIDDLLEAIVLTADAALDLRANPDMPAQGISIEAHLDKGRGPVATAIVHRGTLKIGDPIVVGSAHGRVRALIDDRGENVDVAPPSMPVQVLGLTSVPGAGDNLIVVDDERKARQIADRRETRRRAAMLARSAKRKTLDQIFEEMQKGETQELKLILKGDGAGSVEALEESLMGIEVSDEVSIRVLDRGVGAVTETNVTLAAASDAIIIGFNVRAQGKATELADQEGVEIRYYSVIYQAIDDITAALKGMLKPIYEEEIRGQAEIREIFKSSKFGTIAGCMMQKGTIKRNAKARLIRDGVVIRETTIASLRREKDDVTEVREGYECGMTLANFNDIKIGDLIETFEMVEKPRD